MSNVISSPGALYSPCPGPWGPSPPLSRTKTSWHFSGCRSICLALLSPQPSHRLFPSSLYSENSEPHTCHRGHRGLVTGGCRDREARSYVAWRPGCYPRCSALLKHLSRALGPVVPHRSCLWGLYNPQPGSSSPLSTARHLAQPTPRASDSCPRLRPGVRTSPSTPASLPHRPAPSSSGPVS